MALMVGHPGFGFRKTDEQEETRQEKTTSGSSTESSDELAMSTGERKAVV